MIKPGGPRVGETSRLLKFIETGDPLTTNIAFGGDELDTAYVTVWLHSTRHHTAAKPCRVQDSR